MLYANLCCVLPLQMLHGERTAPQQKPLPLTTVSKWSSTSPTRREFEGKKGGLQTNGVLRIFGNATLTAEEVEKKHSTGHDVEDDLVPAEPMGGQSKNKERKAWGEGTFDELDLREHGKKESIL